MTETEYIVATNRIKIWAAITSLKEVLPGADWGISSEELGTVVGELYRIQDRLFGMIHEQMRQVAK